MPAPKTKSIGRTGRINDRIDSITDIESIGIAAIAAYELIISRSSMEIILAGSGTRSLGETSEEQVIAGPTVKPIISPAALQQIIPLTAVQTVGSCLIDKERRISPQGVMTCLSEQFVVPAITH